MPVAGDTLIFEGGTPTNSPTSSLNALAASAIVVHNTGGTANSGTPAVRLLAVNAATTIEVKKGSVGLAIEAGEVSTVGTITEGYVTNRNGDADLVIGSGVALTTLVKTGGDCLLNCAATTVTHTAGILTTEGTGAITTLNSNGGTTYPNSTGTGTTLDIDGGHVDTTRSSAARTFTDCTLDGPGRLTYDPADVTFTNNVNSSSRVSLTAAA